jgi:RNA-directed DNA polymerase
MVNRPEDDVIGWPSINWRRVEDDVRRLRQRIFTASQAGDFKRVRNLQKLMLRSRASTLMGVRRVTEINAGRKTAGVDGKVALDARAKAELAEAIQHRPGSWTALPVKRVFISKGNAKQRRSVSR